MTPQERKLWYAYLRSCGVRFYRQRVIAPYIVDFYSARAALVIELDGDQHYEDGTPAYDAERDCYLSGLGLRVLRFTNRQIDREFTAVCCEIDRAIAERAGDR